MLNIPIQISIPTLWKDNIFKKSNWGAINYLVGPNGTGKSQFAQQLQPQLTTSGLKVRYLSADRIISWTKA